MAPRTPRGRTRPTIKLVSNKRQKSYSPSSSSRSSSSSPDVSPKKKRKTFVRSKDADELDGLAARTPTRQESPEVEVDFFSPSAKDVVPGSDSEEEASEVDAVPDDTTLGLVLHQYSKDELSEDDDLQIIGETDPADLSTDSEDEESSDVPVRLLTNFTIYNMETRQLVPVAELLQIQYGGATVYIASGTVKPYVEDDDDEDENEVVDEEEIEDSLDLDEQDTQVVRLSKIVEFDIHHVSSRKKKLDSKMYLRTKYAWYILDMPSVIYSPFFTGFWLQHRVLHLVVTAAMANARTTFDAFIASLKVTPETSDAIAIAIKMLGRELTEDDVESDDVKSYLLVILDELRDQERIRIERVPLIKYLRGGLGFYAEGDSSRSSSWSASSRKKHTQSSKSNNPESEVLKHRNPTVVTPLVSKIAAMLFERTLRVAGQLDHDDAEDDAASDFDDFMHRDDPKSIEWLAPAEVEGYYESVDMDGVIYSVGDAVMVMPGRDVDRQRSANAVAETSRSKNTLGNTMWFCRICYMYEDEYGEKVFHGQWYTHGSKTLLQETANPQSLFLMDSCEPDLPLASIIQKCNLRELAIGEDEPTDESNANENRFYHGLTWISGDSSLVQLSQADINDALSQCAGGMQCLSCGLKMAKETQQAFRIVPPRGFFHRGHKYHIDDYVYILPSGNWSSLYKIGRITNVKAMDNPPQVYVRLYGRFDDVVRKMRENGPLASSLRTDERCLFQTSDTVKVDVSRIDGKCYVQHFADSDSIDEWVRHDDHYYLNQQADSVSTASTKELQSLAPGQFKFCQDCYEDRMEQLENAKKLLDRHGPLRGLELYSGAGGLGTGLDQSGFVETRWAVEFSPSAALTYQANHPETTVFNQCSNLLLQHAIDTRDGKRPASLRSLHGNRAVLPPMPKPGDVDFVYGGPPCQSFSGANHYKKANDVRSTLVCNMLSYVEFYRPSYFLLENVTGLLQYPLMGRMVGRAFVEGIKMGVVKFIVRSLTCLGYQVRFKVLQAGQYGAPQGRRRVLFWGAKRGLPLPEFPMPTHASSQKSFFYGLPTGEKLPPPSRSMDPDDLHQCAPLHPVTINDAIGDLPPFDWINPHIICKPTSTDVAEAKSRVRDGIPKVDALSKSVNVTKIFPGFTEPEPYAHKPLSRYQKAMRAHVVGKRVKYQYTKRFTADVVERVVKVPLRPNAFHDDLPPQLHMNRRKYEGLYGRMDGNGHFRTAMTTVQPNAKGGVLLHPSQKRVVTVQECARSQGFPDHYQFLSINKELPKIVQDQHRQIGNAVPVPLALALGKSLGEVLLKTWQEEDRAGSPEV